MVLKMRQPPPFPTCPNCNSMNIDVLWAMCRTARIIAAKWDGVKVDYDTGDTVSGANGLLIRYGLQCADCERHWFPTPGDRIEAISEFCDVVKELTRIYTADEWEVISAGLGKVVQAADPDTVDLTKPLWVLNVTFHNEDPGFYIFTDEFSAWQYLATEIVNEMVTENDYPQVQALLDAGTAEANVEAAKLFFDRCDGSKYSFSISPTEGPLHPRNLPAGDEHKGPGCHECGWKGWEVFNEDEESSPLGLIQACDSCTRDIKDFDDDVANAHAVIAGYRTMEWQRRHIVVTRPGDERNSVDACQECGVPHLLKEMIEVKVPTATLSAYYCPACYGGVKTVVNGR